MTVLQDQRKAAAQGLLLKQQQQEILLYVVAWSAVLGWGGTRVLLGAMIVAGLMSLRRTMRQQEPLQQEPRHRGVIKIDWSQLA
jgi:hypothetical protein